MSALVFREADHTYWLDGQLVPNVTRVIAHLTDYSHLAPEQLAKAQEEGKAVHSMVHLDCKGDLQGVPDWMSGQYKAWCRFKEETGFEPWASEHKMVHDKLRVAGTLDLSGAMPKLAKLRGPAIIDVKRSLYAGPAVGLQTAGYKKIWNDTEPKDLRAEHRFGLVLNPSGAYRLTPFDDQEDEVAFIACLQQYRWRQKHYPEESQHGRSS